MLHNELSKYLVNDVAVFTDTVKQMYPLLPVTLMGHSMGSFIARLVAENYADKYQKLIICGTSGPNPLSKIGICFAKFKKFINGEKYISKTVYNLAFGSYNKGFEGPSNYEWLTKDREIIENIIEGKKIHLESVLNIS